MPNEIYHRSEWGNPKAEGFGDVYFDASATNKLYNHSDNYENSDGTDKILRDIPNKASIVLTPTAYSDGSLNTVIPPYQVLPQELVTNGTFDTDSGWVKGTDTTISGGFMNFSNATSGSYQTGVTTSNIFYSVTYSVSNYSTGTIGVTLNGTPASNGIIRSSNGTFTEIIQSPPTSFGTILFNAVGFTGSIDNVSVKEVQEADFDFSRGSSATRVNEKGLIEDVQILSGELVQNGDFEQIGSELITNGNFDTDSDWIKETGWTISDGKANANVLGTQAIYQSGITLNKWYKVTYTISGYVSGDIRLRVGTTSTPTVRSSNGTFTEYLYATGANQVRISPFTSGFIGSIDNVSVKEVGQNWELEGGWSVEDGLAIYDNSATSIISQSFTWEVGKTYKLTFDVSDFSINQRFDVYTGSTFIKSSSIDTDTSYTIYVSGDGGNMLRFRGFVQQSFSIDNISVIEITDDTDIPRIDYTSGQGALLLEPQSTNLITYSEDFSQSSWVKLSAGTGTTVIVTSNYAISPDGTQNASRLQCDLNGGTTISDQSLIYDTISGIGDTSAFVYVKSNTSSNQTFYLANSLNDRISAVATTEWKKFELNWNASGNGRSLSIGTRGTTGSDDTLDLLIWGAQVEALSFATSYIVSNSGSTTTRSADVANNSGNADLFNDSEGVLYAEIAALADDATNRKIAIGTSSNRIIFGYKNSSNQIRVEVISSGSVVFDNSQTIDDVTTFSKFAIKYKQNDFALWMNGEEIAIDTSGNPPIGLSELAFDDGGSNNFYGNVKSVAVFKEALTDAELESLTSWVSFTEMATDLEYTLE